MWHSYYFQLQLIKIIPNIFACLCAMNLKILKYAHSYYDFVLQKSHLKLPIKKYLHTKNVEPHWFQNFNITVSNKSNIPDCNPTWSFGIGRIQDWIVVAQDPWLN